MVQKLTLYEQRHPELYQDKYKRVALIEMEEDDDSVGDQEVAVAEWTRGAKPVSCKWVKQPGPAKGFDFDLSKTEQIFDLLLKEKQLKLPEGHKIPTPQEMNGMPYCKWHHTFTHATNGKVLRGQIQMAIEQGRLLFGQFAMRVDTQPFPEVNMVDLSHCIGREPGFSFDINMAGLADRHGEDKPESSRSRVQDEEEASPHDWPQKMKSGESSASIVMEKEADSSDRLKPASTRLLPVRSMDLAGDGKLGYGFTSADELEEIDIGPGDKPRPTFVSKKLDPQLKSQLIALLKEYPDCFAWDYTEMPGLDMSIIEHRLPLKKGFRMFQQRARQMKAEILVEVKKEIQKMLDAGFIRPCRYAEWISNVVPVEKKDGRWCVAIDFQNLNSATPKDEYPMPVAETLINAAAGHKVLSFMDGNAGYNQIFMAPEDINKTAFRVPGSVGLFEYVVMTFGLKNAGATYQRAMNYIFHDLIGKLVEIYIDDVVVKSVSMDGHLGDLRRVLDRTRKFGLRMNPKKCAFGVTAGQFLGFLVHERGIEIGLKSQEAVRTMKPPTTKKELQCLIGKINFVRRRMLDAETRYLEIEKLCLCLFFTCTKIQHILLKAEIIVICKSDVIKHMLSAPILKGRLGKWMFALSEFDIRYQPAKAVKGQALADLIAERINTDVAALSVRAWTMFFDGSVCEDGCGIGMLLVSPRGATYSFSIRLSTPCTNNVAEYEAICKGMELLLDAGAEAVEIFGDSKLVISQLTEEYKCESGSLFPLWMQCRELMAQFRYINFHWIPRT
ncbi:hypothetical protein QYE76_069274 [Lolium multiflorum]|uniref:RNase H type-1 domain-containing protein n=1 Tax=Lolium multiflorum TaxID=4521 RepID=A0AAD8WEQ7_LOLMU|nr:hypothetical protein QYE76_069274 [Lolium multiflorum]